MVKLMGMVNIFDVKKWRLRVGNNFDNRCSDEGDPTNNPLFNQFLEDAMARLDYFIEILRDICPDPLCQDIMCIIRDLIENIKTYQNDIAHIKSNNSDFPDHPLLIEPLLDEFLFDKISRLIDLLDMEDTDILPDMLREHVGNIVSKFLEDLFDTYKNDI